MCTRSVGAVEHAVSTLTEIADADPERLRDIGRQARTAVLELLDPATISGWLCNLVIRV